MTRYILRTRPKTPTPQTSSSALKRNPGRRRQGRRPSRKFSPPKEKQVDGEVDGEVDDGALLPNMLEALTFTPPVPRGCFPPGGREAPSFVTSGEATGFRDDLNATGFA
jgi:hypothetical protein